MIIKPNIIALNKHITIKYRASKNGDFEGSLVFKDKIVCKHNCSTVEKLIELLEDEAAQLDTSFFGYKGAIDKFHEFFKEGFTDPRYLAKERDYKLMAKSKLENGASLEAALMSEADPNSAISAIKATALIHRYEAPALISLLENDGKRFLHALSKFTVDTNKDTFNTVAVFLKKHDCAKWPCLTYFPFLWMPQKHMFLKPEVLKEFAERVGDDYQYKYNSNLQYSIYVSLLTMTDDTNKHIHDLQPKDNIDTQGFIWTAIMYDNARDAE